MTHDQAVAHCAEAGLAVVQDESNFDRDITRNRLRHELIPSLETYNPAVREALLRLAEITRADVDWQEQQLVDALAAARLDGFETVCSPSSSLNLPLSTRPSNG